ncbi:Hpt domain-containing protein [Saccharicrinis fermentans]|uniref:Hpt domain protein n=1 Tax=Saccharicrinis fermentans DSM 9555 = JCM 21142 TaxID=869213 RepID=W7Y2N5_9BACT|nr:Hpt domain-containing protein [Saccharicrinis fermentans]GAF01828.1 Hpt domain protein [Saccharicrinis fermentans DSM 9555 = JCM 21142]
MIEKIKKGFINDTLNDLKTIENDLNADMANNAPEGVVEKVFMTVHKIKGTAPMVGIEGLDDIAVKMERVYNAIRNGNLSLSEEIVSNTMKLIPALKAELSNIQQNNLDSEDVNKSLRFFESLI